MANYANGLLSSPFRPDDGCCPSALGRRPLGRGALVCVSTRIRYDQPISRSVLVRVVRLAPAVEMGLYDLPQLREERAE